jgi:RNA polymerase sigma-70 factor (ECF subfamily)
VASQRLGDYAAERPIPFYIWLRQITWEQLIHAHERHLGAQKRSVTRECDLGGSLSAWSRGQLADCMASLTTPSRVLMRQDLRTQIMQQLEQLSPHSQEVLVQRFLEQLSVKEIAVLLGISRGAVQMRIVRALEQLRISIDDSAIESGLR